jgi:SulP family sulfate permease
VAIMAMVSASTFDWGSLRSMVRHPRLSSLVMVSTVAVTVATDNLAAGVAVGVMLSGVFFTFKVARLLAVHAEDDAGTGVRTYRVVGQVFFASADVFVDAFDTLETEGRPVRIDVTQAHFWDVTAVAALDKVVQRMQKHGSTVEVIGLNSASAVLVDRLGTPK